MKHLLLSLSLLFLLACSTEPTTPQAAEGPTCPTAAQIDSIFSPYVSGNYEAYVQQNHSLRHLPEARKREHISLLRQHRIGQDSTIGPIRQYIQRSITYKEGSSNATAHLALIYAPGDTNEILLPLIWKDHRWWRR